jgi:hypothetical protein
MKGKQFLIGIAVLALIAVAYIAFDNTESDEYVRGTIGAADTVVAGVESANRYRSEQMTEEDVQLGDTELERLMQSEIIEELIANPSFARAIQDEATRAAMEQDWAGTAFANEQTREALAAVPVEEISAEAVGGASGETAAGDYGTEIPNEETYGDIPLEEPGDDGYGDIPYEESGEDRSEGDRSYNEILDDPVVQVAIEDQNFRDALFDDYVKQLLSQAWFTSALEDEAVQTWLAGAAARDEDELKTAGDEDEFKAAGDEDEFKAAGEEDAFKAAGEEDAFKAAGEEDAFKAIGEGDRFEAAGGDEFKALAESAEFKKALGKYPYMFQKIADDPAFAKALGARVGDFGKLEQGFGRIVLEDDGLRRALIYQRSEFGKVAWLAKTPEFGKMSADELEAFGKSAEFRSAIFEKSIEGFEKSGGFGKSADDV